MQTDVLIIGAGATGTGIARDLALRGVHCVVTESGDINAGASGGNHGLLHSGGRYVSNDTEAARECHEENLLLKRLAPQCVEDCGGLFVAVQGDDENFIADYPGWCAKAGVPVKTIDPDLAREMEPVLSDKLIAAYEVADASIDPFKLSLENMAHAKALTGSTLLRRTAVIGFDIEAGRIVRVQLVNTVTGEKSSIEATQIVNAAGAWTDRVAAMAGADISMLYSQGTLLVTHERMTDRVVNRLRPPGDGDILVPGGTVSILGTTSVTIPNPDLARPTVAEVDVNVRQGAGMIPSLMDTRYVRAYCGVRPLISAGGGDGRSVSRGFALFDHEDANLSNFCSVAGGKLTTFRMMAEKTADLVCRRLGNTKPSLTVSEPLPEASACEWTEPGRAPKLWAARHDSGDELLCECEMVPASAVDEIIHSCRDEFPDPGLQALGKRSRIGKGSCQGAFCGVRVAAHLYENGQMDSRQGLVKMREFFEERFKGQRPALWNAQLVQAELAEALHCGLLGLELVNPDDPQEVE
ncbi:anaerobic glycerol-3-phosphate dehydrogenase subunit A [Desulfovibrio ferrophilus]|uniref:Glycerol-3-phosphate dehydrogenase n=1 Tax=Desulfovibrio ferrophilus TaxID=241368 RepID=A0A2Z6AY78_9BACT|nr:anaerobic glycerol-3-phosphate dehydrogenase subunit A [Desulfovibrio ferrophilus]BBD08199.1 glycerol-3-phosphate dehydrogenase [Desulfovibrio ferrophilus]